MSTPEDMAAKSIARLRTAKGLTYEQLAALMKIEGVTIHPSAIQKTEKSGRKPTINELTAYASIFAIPIESLWGAAPQVQSLAVGKADIRAACAIRDIANDVSRRYSTAVRMIAIDAEKSSTFEEHLRNELQGFLEKWREDLVGAASSENIELGQDRDIVMYAEARAGHGPSPRVIFDVLHELEDIRAAKGAEESGE